MLIVLLVTGFARTTSHVVPLYRPTATACTYKIVLDRPLSELTVPLKVWFTFVAAETYSKWI